MPRFSANLGFLFTELPEIDRVAGAAAAGFKAVEMHWPYEVPAADMRSALTRSQVTMLGLNTPVGNAAAGDFGLGALAGRENEFQQAVDQAVSYGHAIGATAVHCMSGTVSSDSMAIAERTFVANLTLAADKAARAGMTVLIEPINHRDKPGYFLHTVEQAASIIDQVGRRNVKIMFDCYHTQIMQGDLTRRLKDHLDLVGHVQVAAVPSRAEPDEGEIDCRYICQFLDRLGYDGWIGAEYKPRGRTEDGLGWLTKWTQDPSSTAHGAVA
ncbi:hydroxypyruvate isomerase family protein [Microvirga lotononidis]|uniref:Hydroxypyruvate isomerase n=1 Tax=Microvirga lotononidis TaxID=864069 RepID=I4YYC7_9HYPH|nr:TIM barrel protein [Microvirga lotononidis]EIM28969.1 hydroxypyruvate isomerase [Microvirga lotononidis]WQO26885.1 TIM barrel protein [Microvirga lotononidis]